MQADYFDIRPKDLSRHPEVRSALASALRAAPGLFPGLGDVVMLWIAFFLACSIAALFLQQIYLGLLLLVISGALFLFVGLTEKTRRTEDRLINSREETRRFVARSLNTHDDERRKIARELHDEIGQELTAVLISLNVLTRQPHGAEMQRELRALGLSVSQVVKKVNGLSQRLHPSLVEYMGLGGALAVLCRETESRHQMKVELSGCGLLDGISVESATCLFTVAQEALANAMRHSHSKCATVEISNANGYGQLRVRDSGCGFDTTTSKHNRGFGIIRMQERVLSLNGVMHISSIPEKGTEVTARVPLEPATCRSKC